MTRIMGWKAKTSQSLYPSQSNDFSDTKGIDPEVLISCKITPTQTPDPKHSPGTAALRNRTVLRETGHSINETICSVRAIRYEFRE